MLLVSAVVVYTIGKMNSIEGSYHNNSIFISVILFTMYIGEDETLSSD